MCAASTHKSKTASSLLSGDTQTSDQTTSNGSSVAGDRARNRLLARVDRAIADLRLGAAVSIIAGKQRILMVTTEPLGDHPLAILAKALGTDPKLVLSRRRASVLNLTSDPNQPGVIALPVPNGELGETLVGIADPCAEPIPSDQWSSVQSDLVPEDRPDRSPEAAAVALAKLARLLPAAVIATPADDDSIMPPPGVGAIAPPTPQLEVSVDDIFSYQETAARSMRLVSEATVPLDGAEDTRILAFRPSDGGTEHLAIVVGTPPADGQPVLCRLHSECFTGDLLGSLRCDCGDQLRGAITRLAEDGGGVLLYLAQEGRGIGLVNKLRAYRLQDLGFDTLDANGQLGFDDDERIYLPAARILSILGYTTIRLLTNNPLKVEALGRYGITISERVAHAFPSNPHNLRYLTTKANRSGHLF